MLVVGKGLTWPVLRGSGKVEEYNHPIKVSQWMLLVDSALKKIQILILFFANLAYSIYFPLVLPSFHQLHQIVTLV